MRQLHETVHVHNVNIVHVDGQSAEIWGEFGERLERVREQTWMEKVDIKGPYGRQRKEKERRSCSCI